MRQRLTFSPTVLRLVVAGHQNENLNPRRERDALTCGESI
jgi:hypothetical protein